MVLTAVIANLVEVHSISLFGNRSGSSRVTVTLTGTFLVAILSRNIPAAVLQMPVFDHIKHAVTRSRQRNPLFTGAREPCPSLTIPQQMHYEVQA